jgi:hypothetical protein
MVNVAYLVLCHTNPQVIKRTIRALSSDACAFFIHLDLKSDIERFSCIKGENVFFSQERLRVYWGEFSQTEAIALLIRQALESPRYYDYLVLLSGSEYPLRSSAYIHEFLEINGGSEFISLVKMPALGKPLSRICTVRYPSDRPVRRFAGRALAKLGFAQRDYRKHLGGCEPYSGSTWWALSREACDYILRFMASNTVVERYFRNTFASDEAFFHTILGNSPFRPTIRRNLLYEDWSTGGPSPVTLKEAHLRRFTSHEKVWLEDMYGSGEALFARKFSDDDLNLLDRIDEMVLRKERSQELQEASQGS